MATAPSASGGNGTIPVSATEHATVEQATSRRPTTARDVCVVCAVIAAVLIVAGPLLRLMGLRVADDVEFTTMMVAAAGVASVASILMTMNASRRRGPDRRVWALFAAGGLAWATGAVLWIANTPLFGAFPTIGPADALFLVLPTAWAAAAIVRSDHKSEVLDQRNHRSTREVDALDAAIVGLSVLLIMSIPAYHLGGVTLDDTTTLVTMLYPATDAVVLMLIVRSISRNPLDRRAFSLIACGVAAFGVADVAYLWASQFAIQDRSLSDASWVCLVWIAAFILLGAGAWTALSGPRHGELRARRRITSSIPVGIGTIAAILALLDLTQDNSATWTTTTLVVIMTLLLARQSMTLSENRRLSENLVVRVRDLEHQAGHDALTELANRERLSERLQSLIDTADPNRCSAVLFLDIDLLKSVNDSLGHAVGDELIRAVATRVGERFGGEVVRFGGDEFVVLMRRRPSLDAVTAESRALAEAMHEPFSSRGLTLTPSVSVGVSVVSTDATPEELLRQADTALYHAKAQGRGCAAVFDRSMDVSNTRRVRLASQLRRGLDAHEFELHYQPVVELDTGQIVTAEALLRWRHPEHGLLTPDRFLDEADAIGLLPELGRQSLIEATRRFAEVNARDLGHPVRVTVNLSASELGPTAITNVTDALAASGLDPQLLVLEITEDVIIDESVSRTLQELCAIGVRIAIDDFGTGNSSLRQLGDYPASVLKIDRSFIDGIAQSEDRFIVASLVELARRLELSTVGEGVETIEQASLLHELGCVHGQGWLFDRAVPFDELDQRWLRGPESTARALRALGRSAEEPTAAEATEAANGTEPAEAGESSDNLLRGPFRATASGPVTDPARTSG